VPRLLAFVVGLVVAALLGLAVLMLLAYGTGPGHARSAEVPGLSAEVSLALSDDGVAVIEASSEADLFAALGYAHALRNAWPMTLRRQAAAGALSRWFPDSTGLALDRHTLRLGFADAARSAYAALPDSARVLLDAYAEGVNAAFRANRLARTDDFILLDVEPEPWLPWHPLAVERLIAYLATPPLAPEAAAEAEGPALRETAELRRFLAADSLLRDYLQLGGMQHSLAFATTALAPEAGDTLGVAGGTAFYQRIVHGGSALPLVQEAEFRIGGRRVLAATVPGTLALLGGFADDGAWAVLPSSAARLRTTSTEPPPPSHGRVVRRDGAEALVEAYRAPGLLFIARAGAALPPPPPDTLALGADTLAAGGTPPPVAPAPPPVAPAPPPVAGPEPIDPAPGPGWWVLEWAGFQAGSDLGAWLALLAGQTPTFAVFTGGGLRVSAEGAAEPFGQPAYVQAVPGGLVVGASPQAEYVAERLAAPDSLRPTLEALGRDTYSPWAARLAPPLAAALGHPDSVVAEFREAASFLMGWDHRYDPEGIGASIFETWMGAYRSALGGLPNPDTLQLTQVTRTDTLLIRFDAFVAEEVAAARAAGRRPPPVVDTLEAFPERADSLVAITRTRREDTADLVRLKGALRQGLATLRREHGRPGASWRWERVQRAHLVFPGWGDTPRRRPGGSRFRPVPLAEGGHPTSIGWGPSEAFEGAEAAGSWAGWTSSADWGRVRFLARTPYHEPPPVRHAERPDPAPIRVAERGATPEQTVRLTPPPQRLPRSRGGR
jgi:penicillin G amidase